MLKRFLLIFLLLAGVGLLAGVTGCEDSNDGGDDVVDVEPTDNSDDSADDDADQADDDSDQSNDDAADQQDDVTPTPEPEPEPEPVSVNLTGDWQRPGLGSIYRLNQRGVSLQGAYFELEDPYVSGDIAGTVVGSIIEMDVAVHYTDGIRTDFVAHKSGSIISSDHIRLVVTSSPVAQGQVQNWYR
ncbi:MAG TPA: hypothetical protein P5567_06915 [Kiritimatiellia bacterium]|nr:hypothetical protein [Kiritimatiellia bacterium]HRZ12169.1 hypothetical protein [Kiritimatiellia bacterium]HSA18073.1 hypothetical protein [Kiritimatiellia bacterium]